MMKLAIVTLAAWSSIGHAPQASLGAGGSHGGLQLALSLNTTNRSAPSLDLILKNVGTEGFVVNLGFMLANGRRMFPQAIRLTGMDATGKAHTILFGDPGPGVVAGRMDDYLIALAAGASHSLHAMVSRTGLSPGRYRVTASFEGRPARSPNLDTLGMALLNYWTGTTQSNEVIWDVP